MTYFPDEIWCIVCTQLWDQRDFNTLFHCACSWKQLATIAVMNLYRMPDSLILDIESHNAESIDMKSASLWRTIIRSSLGKTFYPYSQYIRTLNLGYLKLLLRICDRGPSEVSKVFFHGDLAQFQIEYPAARTDEGESQWNVVETLSRFGDAITKQTPLLEVLIGDVSSEELSRWILRFPRLKILEPWVGVVKKEHGSLIHTHCPSFKGLHLQRNSKNSDFPTQGQDSIAFLNGLRPQSLASFTTSRSHACEPALLQALSCHGELLTELKLNLMGIPSFSLLKGCINLTSLSLTGGGAYFPDPETSSVDACRETFIWLKERKRLRNLALICFARPTWLKAILLDKDIQLTSLKYEGFEWRGVKWQGFELQDAGELHNALANQTSLQCLWLRTDVKKRGMEADLLVDSLSKLATLTNLHLVYVCDNFVDRHIVQLAKSLTKLEGLSTGKCEVTDAVWDEVASLRSLQRLKFGRWNRFTTSGILSFIEKLGPSNQGLVLSVSIAYSEELREHQRLIQETMAKTINGRFEYNNQRMWW